MMLEHVLSDFGITAKVVNATQGPTVTRYEIEPAPGVKVSRIVNLTDDIALNLGSTTYSYGGSDSREICHRY